MPGSDFDNQNHIVGIRSAAHSSGGIEIQESLNRQSRNVSETNLINSERLITGDAADS